MSNDRKVPSDKARRDFSGLLGEVEHGDNRHIQITRYGKVAAVLVSREWYEQAQQALANGKEKP